MSCTCTTITAYSLSCTPVIGGVRELYIENNDGTTGTYVSIQAMPDSGGYTSVMTYDRAHNLKYFTSTITFDVGALNSGNRTLVEALPCPTPRKMKLVMNSGHTIIFDECFVKEANFSVSGSKTDASSGQITIEAITIDAPQVTDPTTD